MDAEDPLGLAGVPSHRASQESSRVGGALPDMAVIWSPHLSNSTDLPPGRDGSTLRAAAVEAAESVASSGVAAVVVEVEPGDVSLYFGRDLATAMGARHLRLDSADGVAIEQAGRLVLDKGG